MSGRLAVVDVWGGPGIPANVFQARSVLPAEDALKLIRMEVNSGYVVTVVLLSVGAPRPAEFDHRRGVASGRLSS